MDTPLKYTVIASFLFSIISLTVMVLRTFSFGKKELYAKSKGSVRKGIIYAFGKGMMPWEKESAGKHLPTYIGGIIYHGGVFLSLFYLFVVIVEIPIPAIPLQVFRVLCAAGIAAGMGLLVKRYAKHQMRALSCPDDAAANILVDLFLLAAFFHTLLPGWNSYLFPVSIMMFLYIPFGKIRHCFFFFYIRILFGLFYGRRDVFPPKSYEEV
jgi:hypothetical protein